MFFTPCIRLSVEKESCFLEAGSCIFVNYFFILKLSVLCFCKPLSFVKCYYTRKRRLCQQTFYITYIKQLKKFANSIIFTNLIFYIFASPIFCCWFFCLSRFAGAVQKQPFIRVRTSMCLYCLSMSQQNFPIHLLHV